MADAPELNTTNDWGITKGENLPNHSASQMGRGKFVRQGRSDIPTFRDRQTAYRYAAWLVAMADVLPDDDGQEGITFDDVLSAVQEC